MLEIIQNHNGDNHEVKINEFIQVADEIYIAVAFLKEQGLRKIKDNLRTAMNRGAIIKILAGGDYGLTEPKALQEIINLFQVHQVNCEIRLAKYLGKHPTFHTKMYLFKNQDETHIMIGSANLTSGGIVNNEELSLLLHDDDSTWISSFDYFNRLFNQGTALLEESDIKDYTEYYKRLKEKNRELAHTSLTGTSQFRDVDLRIVDELYDQYRKSNEFLNTQLRIDKYNQAEAILNRIGDENLYDDERISLFKRLIMKSGGKYPLWHSAKLYRRIENYQDFIIGFTNLVRTIRTLKDNNPQETYSIGFKKMKGYKGIGTNILTEIMITFNPDSYAILNGASRNVINKEFGNVLHLPYSFTQASSYQLVCDFFTYLKEKYNFRNLLEVDSFLYHIKTNRIEG